MFGSMKAPRKRVSRSDSQEIRFLRIVGKRILELCAKKGITIEHLAYEAGVSKGYLYDIANGNGNPTVVILHRIASALEIPMWNLVKP